MTDHEQAAILRNYVGMLRGAAVRLYSGAFDPSADDEVCLLALADRLDVRPGRGITEVRSPDVELLERHSPGSSDTAAWPWWSGSTATSAR